MPTRRPVKGPGPTPTTTSSGTPCFRTAAMFTDSSSPCRRPSTTTCSATTEPSRTRPAVTAGVEVSTTRESTLPRLLVLRDQLPLEHLARGAEWEGVGEDHLARVLVRGEVLLAVGDDVLLRQVAVLHDHRADLLAVLLVRHADHRHLGHAVEPQQDLLDV